MRYLVALAAIGALASCGTPAYASDSDEYRILLDKQESGFRSREIVYQALNAADAAETCAFLASGRAREGNPLFGSDPSCAKVVGIKAGFALAHYFAAKFIYRRDPKAAKTFQIVTIGIQGGVVAANLRFMF